MFRKKLCDDGDKERWKTKQKMVFRRLFGQNVIFLKIFYARRLAVS